MAPSHRRLWIAVSALFAFSGSLMGIWASRIPAVAAKHGLEKGALGLVLLCLAAGAILAFPLAGRWADRYGAYRVTGRLAGICAVAIILIAFAPATPFLVAALFFFGASIGAVDVAMNVWAAEVERHIAKPVMSSFHAMFSLGAGLGGTTGYIAASTGIGLLTHFIFGAMGIALITFALASVNWTSGQSDTPQPTPVFAIPKGALLPVSIIGFCAMLGEGAVTDWSAVFMIETTGADEATAALGFTVFSAAMVVMRLVGDRVIAAIGPVPATRLAGVTATLGLIGTLYGAALSGFALLGLGYAILMPLAFSRAANDPHIPAGTAIAQISTLGYGGMLLGPPVIGFIAQATSLHTAFAVLAALSFLIVPLANALAPSDRART